MGTFWKVMAGLLLTLPLAAYITGTLVVSEADMPTERTPIVISEAPSLSPEPGSSARPSDGPSASKTKRPAGPDGDDDSGGGDDDRPGDDSDGGDDDDGIKIVRPTPNDLDDDWDGGDDSDDSDDDESGDDDGGTGDD